MDNSVPVGGEGSLLRERLTRTGPKRILALDGGGIRGALSLGFLARIERLLRDRYGNPDLRLRDYFDLIGGTSTGSIIAAALAVGMEVAELQEVYRTLGPAVFSHHSRHVHKLEAWFDAGRLEAELNHHLGELTLGDDAITTGLCIVTKRADTRSTWPLINHPDGRFYADNRAIPLRKAVRASTAAPALFRPEALDVGQAETGAFVDGGVSMANNPSMLLLLVATLRGFPFHWETGEDRLLLTSVGTGTWSQALPAEVVLNRKVWSWALEVPSMLIADAGLQAQLLLQALSRSPTPWPIDAEMGDLTGDVIGGTPLLHYLRFDGLLEPESLQQLELGYLTPKLAQLRDMANGAGVADLLAVGQAAAQAQVKESHFPASFDIAAAEASHSAGTSNPSDTSSPEPSSETSRSQPSS